MARGGKRPGAGRIAGGKNKATMERDARVAELAALAIEQNRAAAEHAANVESAGGSAPAVPPKPRRKLGKEVLDDLMQLGMGYAARFQPIYDKDGRLVRGDPAKFREWAEFASDNAFKLARFQSPTYRAIVLREDTPANPDKIPTNGKVLDLEANREPGQAGEAYMRLIARPRSAA